jgi:hypothetical protein
MAKRSSPHRSQISENFDSFNARIARKVEIGYHARLAREARAVMLLYDHDNRRFVANGAVESKSTARSGIEEPL